MSEADFIHIGVSVAFMAALGLVLSVLLVVANRKLWVYEDPRIDDVEDMLPRSNCGACRTRGQVFYHHISRRILCSWRAP